MNKTKEITVLGLLTAITIFLATTPLGFIPLGPIAATTMHMPVIIGAIMYGKKTGAIMGLIFGLISFTRAYVQPTPTSFVAMDPLVSVVPRLFMGFLTGLLYEKIKKLEGEKLKKISLGLAVLLFIYSVYRLVKFVAVNDGKWMSFLIISLLLAFMIYLLGKRRGSDLFADYLASVFGTFFNTVSFLSMLYILHGAKYAEVLGMTKDQALAAVLSIAMVNGVVELVASGIIIPAISGRLKKQFK